MSQPANDDFSQHLSDGEASNHADALENERKTRTILLMAIPKEHLRRFHGMDDAKEIWDDAKKKFGAIRTSLCSVGLEKGYDREVSFLPCLVLLMKLCIHNLWPNKSEVFGLGFIEDLEQIDDIDIEEMDINWQIAMIAIRMKKFYKKTGRRV
ncbi:hypothetical protein Tco_1204659 [Tanacetum coccineum]